MATLKLCSVKGCGKPIEARGFCNLHYRRWRKWDNPLLSKKRTNGTYLAWLELNKDYKGDDCLIWPFFRGSGGYGAITFLKKTMSPGKAMCILAYGEAPAGKETAHSCGKGSFGCVNPRHLRWATKRENEDDKQQHGTILRGKSHHWAKLSESDVRRIRLLAVRGIMQKTIADMFKVDKAAISLIVSRRNWGWLK